MEQLVIWASTLGAVAVAVAANSISAIWAEHKNKFTWWLVALILISPLVFITFGLVTAEVGVAVGAGTMDSLLSLSTITIGLIFFREKHKLSTYQYWGLLCISIGIILMQFSH